MKKLLSLALVLMLVLVSLASCDFLTGGGEDTTTKAPEGTTAPAPQYDIDSAAAFFDNLYKEDYSAKKDEESGELVYPVVQADFTVVAQIVIETLSYSVEWTVDTDKVTVGQAEGGFVTINVDEESPEEVQFTLTATIKDGNGKTATRSYKLIVPEYVLWSHEEYMAAVKGDSVVVKGVVVAMNSVSAGNKRNHLFLADLKTDGGYYSYQMEADPVELGIEIGMVVEVSGPAEPYSSGGVTMPEIKGGSARIIDTNKQTVATLDVTAKFAAGESLIQYVGRPVTIKGVEIGEQVLGGSSDYLYFKLGDKSAYLRTYLTDLNYSMVSKDEAGTVTSAAKTQIEAEHLAHFGYQADVTGIVIYYGAQVYLMPVDANCFVYGQKIEKTPAQKVADTLDSLKISTSFSADAVVDLPTSVYSDVVLSVVSNNEAIVIADGKMTIVVPEKATEVTLTVTATCGEATATKDVTVKLSKVVTPVKDIIDLGLSKEHNNYTEEKYLVAGIITEITNSTYGNMKIKDEFGNELTIYGTYGADGELRYDKLENKPVEGDYVVILGIVGQYSGTAQVKNGWILSYTTPTSVKDAIDLGAAKDHNTYTEEKHVVTGVITEVYNTTYGNMKITDADGNILTIYGTYSATGLNRYDKMAVQPVAGDTVTVYGIVGQYSGTPQIKNAWIVAHTAATTEEPEETTPSTPETPEVPAESTLTIAEAIALGLSKDDNVFEGEKYYVTGVIKEVYNTQYGNMRIIDEAGNVLTIYGSYSADGSTRYDALTVKPVAGDTVTIYGYVGRYGTTPQIKNGWIVAHVAVAPSEPEVTTPEETTPETPAEPSEPAPEAGTVVGVIKDIAAANGWVDGNNSGRYDSFNLNEYISVSVTATATGSYGVNSGKPYGTPIDNWRIYQNESPAITIAAAAGKTIVSVKVTYDVSKTGILTLNGANVESATLVEVNANSITFGVGNTGTVTNGQVRITAIEVVYA